MLTQLFISFQQYVLTMTSCSLNDGEIGPCCETLLYIICYKTGKINLALLISTHSQFTAEKSNAMTKRNNNKSIILHQQNDNSFFNVNTKFLFFSFTEFTTDVNFINMLSHGFFTWRLIGSELLFRQHLHWHFLLQVTTIFQNRYFRPELKITVFLCII